MQHNWHAAAGCQYTHTHTQVNNCSNAYACMFTHTQLVAVVAPGGGAAACRRLMSSGSASPAGFELPLAVDGGDCVCCGSAASDDLPPDVDSDIVVDSDTSVGLPPNMDNGTLNDTLEMVCDCKRKCNEKFDLQAFATFKHEQQLRSPEERMKHSFKLIQSQCCDDEGCLRNGRRTPWTFAR